MPSSNPSDFPWMGKTLVTSMWRTTAPRRYCLRSLVANFYKWNARSSDSTTVVMQTYWKTYWNASLRGSGCPWQIWALPSQAQRRWWARRWAWSLKEAHLVCTRLKNANRRAGLLDPLKDHWANTRWSTLRIYLPSFILPPALSSLKKRRIRWSRTTSRDSSCVSASTRWAPAWSQPNQN